VYDIAKLCDERLQGIASQDDFVIYAQNYTTLINYLENIVGAICVQDPRPPRKEQLSRLTLCSAHA